MAGAGGATALYLPSTSYLLIWPFIFSLLALLVVLRSPEGETPSLGTGVVLLLLAVPAVLLWAPVVPLVGAAFAAGAGPILAVVTGLVASSLVPLIALLSGERRRWVLPLVIVAIGLGLSLVEAASARYDARRPRPSTFFYALDSANQEAFWASWGRGTDSWTSQFLSGDAQRRPMSAFFTWSGDALTAEAPVLPLPAPVVTDLAAAGGAGSGEREAGSETDGEGQGPAAPAERHNGRSLRLKVRSARQGSALYLELRSDSAITSLAIDGLEVDVGETRRNEDSPAGYWRAMFYGGARDGFEMEVGLDGGEPLEVAVVEPGVRPAGGPRRLPRAASGGDQSEHLLALRPEPREERLRFLTLLRSTTG